MKTTKKILVGLGFATVVGFIIYMVRNHRKVKRMSEEVADQGYETAHDILFPPKKHKRKKVHYGPVLPE